MLTLWAASASMSVGRVHGGVAAGASRERRTGEDRLGSLSAEA
ncbi:hypothetical protein [Streptomyces sp. NPDC006784]